MRIAHVIYDLGIGGGEVFLSALARSLARDGHVQSVACIGGEGPLAGDLAAAGIPMRAFRKRSKAGGIAIARLAAHLRAAAADVIVVHGEPGVFWGLPAARLAGCRPVVVLYQDARESRVRSAAERLLLRGAARIIATSGSVTAFARGELGVSREALVSIPCGLDLAPFRRAREADERRDREKATLVTVGRLVPRKGHATAVRAMARVVGARPDAQLVVAGDGPERERLRRLAVEIGVSTAVAFPGTVRPTMDLLAGADLFLFPSLSEPQGLALVEAAAMRLPIVASGVGGICEMVSHGVDGVLVPPGDDAALAAAILRLLASPEERQRLGWAAASMAERYDIGAVAARHLVVYAAARCHGA